MSFLLDTNILPAYLRGQTQLNHRFIQHSGRIYTSSLNMAELYVWANRRPLPEAAISSIDRLMDVEVSVLQHDLDCARIYGETYVALQKSGKSPSPMDLMIASVALVYDLTLVTHNTRDFESIPNLRIQDWLMATNP
ncbi:MAG: type II toxin-antitoxin system VapC family toxin [Candidatus Omnitrophica bacterium]|nr:type II toxin-antitoxin system VapC family toxin [Candidatus Omnitrophota bacterium]